MARARRWTSPGNLARALAVLVASTLLTGCGLSPHDAVMRGDIEALRRALDADPGAVHRRDRLDKTPLHHAAAFRALAAMNLLAERGADVNATDRTGMTPLHVAGMLGRGEEAEWLLAHGADPHARDAFGDTPLHTAAMFGGGQALRPLIRAGARLDARNDEGLTPLELAERHGHARVAEALSALAARR